MRELKKTVARLEKALARNSEREQRLHDQLLAAATDHVKAAELDAELREVHAEREAFESEWLEAAEQLDE